MHSTRGRGGWLCLLLPIWSICFGLTLRDVLTPTPFPPALVRFDVQHGPTVLGPRTARTPLAPLEVGDELVRWGRRTLRGVGETEFFAAVAHETSPTLRARVTVVRASRELELTLTTPSFARFWPRTIAGVVFLLVGIILWYRAPPDALTHAFVTMLFGGAFLFVCTFSGPPWLVSCATLVQALGVSTLTVYGLKGMLLFPHGRSPRSRALRALPWLCLPLGLLDVERTRGWLVPQALAHQLSFGVYVLVFAALIVDSVLKYRRSDPVERRKIKWVLWGTFVAALLPVSAAAVALAAPSASLDFYVAVASLAIIPICLLIAIVYYNLFDINRVISATASFGLLLFGAWLLGLWGLPRLSSLVLGSLKVSEPVAQLLAASLLAFAALTLQRRVSPAVERVLFAERAALQQGMVHLVDELMQASSPSALLQLAADRLRALLSPDVMVLYMRSELAFESVVAHGAAIAPALPLDTGLAASLRGHRGVLSFERGGRAERVELDRMGLAAVGALDARVVVPFHRGDQLLAMLCLGAKGSGDLYVQSDLALLGSLSLTVSNRLAGLALDVLLHETRKAHAAIQRYVPSAVAEELASGSELEHGERDLTLLFLDIRGYSSYAEGRAAGEVFATIDNYTRSVSAIAHRHEGHIVEFNGDGMMVVFGAPRPHPDKERAAVDTGLQILEHMAESSTAAGGRLSVGVGIASGPAYVGNIRAVDRMIWTAIGETTNRAARLQALTRELGASMIIDEPTYRALPARYASFVSHKGVRLRGHARSHTLFALPGDSDASDQRPSGLAMRVTAL